LFAPSPGAQHIHDSLPKQNHYTSMRQSFGHTTIKGDNVFYYPINGLSDVRLTQNDDVVRDVFPDRTVKGIE
jgi:hypothetical protein